MDVRGVLDLRLGETPFDSINEIIMSDEGFSCGSGDSFVKNQVEMVIDIVDMEAYGIAKICAKEQIDFECYKWISDFADENAMKDWQKNQADGAEAFLNIVK